MTISCQDSVHNTDGAEVAHHQNALKEDVVNDSDDEDVKLERRLRLICQVWNKDDWFVNRATM